ncbi:DUF11 domain-containing protein [Vibrio sp. SS-MA-C1-2]|uniref:DUF11 domain-containing protein n=1 Tax=Vibrio sp. SS-MA-C1-2 TaxID=2908646 RepID=UPI001F37C43B|nr:DUF11 domain-containing protein [Vibrio sp. SS-MA-C1-2]UJF17478.1 DUF11 domain-containing protein [Vibrio sp. SS-MA-C1-2]
METRNKWKLTWAAGLILGVSSLSGLAYAASTPPDTEITNQATVTYEDALGNGFTATSNEAVITVGQAYAASLGVDRVVSVPIGGMATTVHTLTNEGNVLDTYSMSCGSHDEGGAVTGLTPKAYFDLNGNGQVDSNELGSEYSCAGTGASQSIKLAPGESKDILLQAPTAGTTANTTYGMFINASTSAPGIVVDDLTPNNGLDSSSGGEGSNHDLVHVVAGDVPILQLVKDAAFIPDGGAVTGTDRIEYTVTIRNVGQADASDVIFVDGLPEGTTFVSASFNGSLGADIDAAACTLDEAGSITSSVLSPLTPISIPAEDYNSNGKSETSVAGVCAKDLILESGTTMTVTFSVDFDPLDINPKEGINNIAYGCYDSDSTNTNYTTAECSESNNHFLGEDVLTSIIDGEIVDTGNKGAASDPGGVGDTNPTANIQTVDEAEEGSQFFFYNIVTNLSNTEQAFILTTDIGNHPHPSTPSIGPQGFPEDTKVSYMNANGEIPLLNGNTAPMQSASCLTTDSSVQTIDNIDFSCNQMLVRVMVTLPFGHVGDTDLTATTKITSVSDPSIESAGKDEFLGEITKSTARVDLANSTQATGFGDKDVEPPVNADKAGTGTETGNATKIKQAVPGETVIFDLFIANESSTPDSYILGHGIDTGLSFDAEGKPDKVIQDLPAGWVVVFKDSRGVVIDGETEIIDPVGPAPGLDNVFAYTAHVTVPEDATADTTNIVFSAISAREGAADAINDYKIDAITVTLDPDVIISPVKLENSVQQGGRVEFEHDITNNGFASDTISIGVADTEAANNFNTVIKVVLDDGTKVLLSEVCTFTDPIIIDGVTYTSPTNLDCATNALNPVFTLEPKKTISIVAEVTAPTSAKEGATNESTITVTTSTTSDDIAIDKVTVVTSDVKLKLFKFVAKAKDCGATTDVTTTFQINHSTTILPGECAIWRVVAKNVGTENAKNVVIQDNLPEFTTFVDGTLRACVLNGVAGENTALHNPDGFGQTPHAAGGDIDTEIGDICSLAPYSYADFIDGTVGFVIGTMIPGDKAAVEFKVKVN